MKYSAFVQIMTSARMNRYLLSCGGDSRKAMTLYRKNLQLTQELFTVISCFEVALRNVIDIRCTAIHGTDWLKNGARVGGIFDNHKCRLTKENINDAINKLPSYNHFKLVAELGFGFWRYMFAQNQYNATNRILLQVFPSKPTSTPALQYNNTYVFNQLAKLNDIRNRMAHHEPICFLPGQAIKDTNYARQHYNLILQLFQWMQVDESALLYGLDHIINICDEIDYL
ncbi:Abi family protein [uncultured Mucilaginibacter sp.]|uniref:Abi family protein n=1 Tax=uncultured Mucilaginibacter sp. TaxID=797541 RepID=UPI00262766F4|nr:Abi family protein [uncultured Mucilaginibacter sp.]